MSLTNLIKWCEQAKESLNQQDFQLFLGDFVVKYGNIVLGLTQKRTPVDTGTLRLAWKLGNVELNSIDIKNDVIYASFVEYGTSTMDGRFMMTISIDEVSQALPEVFNADFKTFLSDGGAFD